MNPAPDKPVPMLVINVESGVPSAFTRKMPLSEKLDIDPNMLPKNNIFPSGYNKTLPKSAALDAMFGPKLALKAVSNVPFALYRMMRFISGRLF
jgi:hypothetical protein